MKIGILGSSLESIYLASYFADLEAHVTLLGGADPLAIYEYYKAEVDQEYWFKLLKGLQGRIVYNPNKVKRIQKSFLQKDEPTSRMKDTFRVVTYRDEMEFYEDFDFIIEGSDLTRFTSFLGGDAPAINEEKHSKKELGYFNELNLENEFPEEIKGSLAIFGNFSESEKLKKIFEDSQLELHFFHHPKHEFLENYEKEFEKEVSKFQETRDVEPKRRVFTYENMNVVGLDYLEDRERLYLTLEIPDFRAQDAHFTEQRIRTIAVDKIFHFRDLKQTSSQFQVFLLENEPGYYKIEEGEWKNLNQLKVTAERLKDEFLQYFTKI